MNGCCHLMAFSRTPLAAVTRGSCQAGSESKQAAGKGQPRTQAGIWLSRRGALTPWLTCADGEVSPLGHSVPSAAGSVFRVFCWAQSILPPGSCSLCARAVLGLALRAGAASSAALLCSGPVDLEKPLGTQQSEIKQINNKGTGRSWCLMNVIMGRRMLTTKIFMHH